MITLLQLRREFLMMMIMVTAIIRKALSFRWNLSQYRARDSIMQRVSKKILNSWIKLITSIVLVKFVPITNKIAMMMGLQQKLVLSTEERPMNLSNLWIDRTREVPRAANCWIPG
jgi:hypothetical protein